MKIKSLTTLSVQPVTVSMHLLLAVIFLKANEESVQSHEGLFVFMVRAIIY